MNLTVLFHSWCPGSALTLCLITSPGLKYGVPLSRLVSVALLCGFILTSASLSFLFSSLSWRLVLLNFSCSHCPPSILCYSSSLSQGPSLLFNCFFFFTLSLSSIKRYTHSTNLSNFHFKTRKKYHALTLALVIMSVASRWLQWNLLLFRTVIISLHLSGLKLLKQSFFTWVRLVQVVLVLLTEILELRQSCENIIIHLTVLDVCSFHHNAHPVWSFHASLCIG